MQITVDLIRYEKLVDHSSEVILLDLFEDDDLVDDIFVLGGDELPGGWGDSVSLWGCLCDCCEGQLKRAKHRAVHAWGRLVLPSMMPDELNLRSFPDEGFIASISPLTVTELAADINLASVDELVDCLVKTCRDVPLAMANGYVAQWVTLINEAAQRKLGVIIHLG